MSTKLNPSMRRSALISLLRDRSRWPEGFWWDFSLHGHCAMGLCGQMLMDLGLKAPCTSRVAEAIGISAYDARRIFLGSAFNGTPVDKITPEMVADHLEQIHAQLSLREMA